MIPRTRVPFRRLVGPDGVERVWFLGDRGPGWIRWCSDGHREPADTEEARGRMLAATMVVTRGGGGYYQGANPSPHRTLTAAAYAEVGEWLAAEGKGATNPTPIPEPAEEPAFPGLNLHRSGVAILSSGVYSAGCHVVRPYDEDDGGDEGPTTIAPRTPFAVVHTPPARHPGPPVSRLPDMPTVVPLVGFMLLLALACAGWGLL